jgi:hypothetical protein
MTQVLHCPYCHETDIVRHGKSPEGKQRYRCRQSLAGRQDGLRALWSWSLLGTVCRGGGQVAEFLREGLD